MARICRCLVRWACAGIHAAKPATSAPLWAPGSAPREHALRHLSDLGGELTLLEATLPGTTTLAEVVSGQAMDQGLLPLLCEACLASREFDPRPWGRATWDHLLGTLLRLRERDLGVSLAQVSLLLRSQRALAGAGISSCACKGPLMGQLAYGAWSRRQSGQDIDLLVAPADLDAACVVLQGLGFTVVRPLPRRSRSLAMHHFGELPLRHADGALIDLHWRLCMPYYSFCPGSEGVLSHSRQLAMDGLPGGTIATLSEVETLLFAALHGCKEDWSQWRWLTDVSLLLARCPPRGLRDVIACARHRGCLTMLLTTIALAQRCSGVVIPLPMDITQECPRAAVQARRCERGLLGQGPPVRALLVEVCDHWQDSLRALTAKIRPWPVDWQSLDLPPGLGWGYWIYRPTRLAAKYLTRALRRVRGLPEPVATGGSGVGTVPPA